MENVAGMVILLVVGYGSLALDCFAVIQTWRYSKTRWGRGKANIVTALAVIPLFFGASLLVVATWLIRWLTKRVIAPRSGSTTLTDR